MNVGTLYADLDAFNFGSTGVESHVAPPVSGVDVPVRHVTITGNDLDNPATMAGGHDGGRPRWRAATIG